MSSRAWLAAFVVVILLSSSVGAYLILSGDESPDDPPANDDDPPYVEPTGDVPFRGEGAFLNVEYTYMFTQFFDQHICHYTDDFFRWPSSMYDRSLMSASFCLASSAFGSADFLPYQYYYADAFMTKLGFENIDANEDFKMIAETHTIGAVAGMKKITCNSENDTTLIALSIRGDGYGNEWASNFTIGYGTDSENHHKGFYDSQKKVMDFLLTYIDDNDISGNVKLWISGFSRGAGVANTLAGILDTAIAKGERPLGNDVNLTKHGLYAYTFATPTTICYDPKTDQMDPRSTDYNNIKSIIIYGDIVPMIMFEGLGFERYGKDIVLSDPADENYDARKPKVLDIFNSSHDLTQMSEYFLDDFTPYRIDLGALLNGGEMITYDPNATYTDIKQVLDEAIDGVCQIMEDRSWYVDNVEVLVIDLYEKVCGDDKTYSLDGFVATLVMLIMTQDGTQLLNMMMNILMDKDISQYLVDNIRMILQYHGKDTSVAQAIADDLSDLLLTFKGLFFNGDPAFLNIIVTIGMNIGFVTYAHNAPIYKAWIMVSDPMYQDD